MPKGWVLFVTFLLFSGFAYAVDTDEDGLSDSVEFTLGSSPYHKDIFVEIDWLIVNGRNLKPRPGFVQFVQSIFAAAPVLNPDGFTGINIHIQLSQGIRTNRTVLGYKNPNGDYNWGEFDSIKNAYFTPSRRSTHHYCLFAQDYGDSNGRATGSSGISRNGVNFNAGASDFLVTLGGPGWFNKPNGGAYKFTQAGTFVHELGHNLGLRHGGTDHTQYKPNLLSLMNYSFQTDGIPYTRADGVRFRIFDYCRLYLPVLNENNLNESRGLGPFASDIYGVYGTTFFVFEGGEFVQYDTFDATSFLDWNQDGRINTSVRTNINQDVVTRGNTNYHKFSSLRGIEQWSRLVYTGGWVGAAGISAASKLPSTTNLRCLHYNDLPKRKISAADTSNVRYGTYMDIFKK
jgi:hypothetical protein